SVKSLQCIKIFQGNLFTRKFKSGVEIRCNDPLRAGLYNNCILSFCRPRSNERGGKYHQEYSGRNPYPRECFSLHEGKFGFFGIPLCRIPFEKLASSS